jgi:hypothetical protein
MSLQMGKRTEGWGNLDNVRNAHYFRKGLSLCGRWMAWGSPRWERNQALGTEATKGTCKTCWTKRAAEEQRGNN